MAFIGTPPFSNSNGNGGSNGIDVPDAAADQIIKIDELCWDTSDPNFNQCGNSAALKIKAVMNELDTHLFDSRVKITIEPTFPPTQNVVSDVTTVTYTDPNGVVQASGLTDLNMLDLFEPDILELETEGKVITKVSFTNVNATVKRIKIEGTILVADIQTTGGTFIMLRKIINQIIPGTGIYNPSEIVFYKQACSNYVQGNGFVTFDYNMAYTTPNKNYKFWIDQTTHKINDGFFSPQAFGLPNVWVQTIWTNLKVIQPPLEIIRTITFSGACAQKVIRKRVTFLTATYPFLNSGLVNSPLTLNIVDF